MQGGTGLCKSNNFNRITMITWLWMPLYISTAQVRQLCQMVPRPTKICELITLWCSQTRIQIIKYCSSRDRINDFIILPAYWFPRPWGRKISQTGWMLSRARSSYLTRSRTLEKYIYHFHKYSSEFIKYIRIKLRSIISYAYHVCSTFPKTDVIFKCKEVKQ